MVTPKVVAFVLHSAERRWRVQNEDGVLMCVIVLSARMMKMLKSLNPDFGGQSNPGQELTFNIWNQFPCTKKKKSLIYCRTAVSIHWNGNMCNKFLSLCPSWKRYNLPFQGETSLGWIFCLHSLIWYCPEQRSRTSKVVITCNSAGGGLKLIQSKYRQKNPKVLLKLLEG